MKIFLETLGCQMNRLDSELVTALLREAGHEMVADRRGADAVLYNTCSVRRHAEQKVCSRLGDEGRRKAQGGQFIIGVLGCMAQREGEQLARRYPQVDVICAPGRLSELADLLARADTGERAIALDPQREQGCDRRDPDDLEALDSVRDVHAAPLPARAMVRAIRGCDIFCTYCIVPFVRGPERSRDPRRIADEVRRLVEAGRTEITLLGQAVNRYRWRAGKRQFRFSDLLEMLSPIAGLRRLRFVTSHPLDFTDDILHAMCGLPNVCEYIHVPAQSGSDAVLKRMARRYSRAQYDELVDRARKIVPDVVLAGDFIVGFPGESEADHRASADLIRRSGYKNSFIFKYSSRPGTSAARNLPDDVPLEVKKRRNNELLAVQAEVSLEHHLAYVGRTLEVLVEGPSPRAGRQPTTTSAGQTQLVGRTRWDHVVVFLGPETLAGEYVSVEITDATPLTLFAGRV